MCNRTSEDGDMKKQIKMVVWAVMLVMLTTGSEIAEAGRRKQVPVTTEITEEHYRHGLDYYRQKEYFRAKIEFDKVLFLSPGYKSAGKYLKLATRKIATDLAKRAEEDYQRKKLSRRKESVCEYLYDSGRDSYFAGRYQKAFQSFKQVLLLEPAHKGATVYLLQIRENLTASNAVSSEVTEEIEQRTKLREEAARLKVQKKAEEKQAREAKKQAREARKSARQEEKERREAEKKAGKEARKELKIKRQEAKRLLREAKQEEKKKKKEGKILAAETAKLRKLKAREAKKNAKEERKKAREEAKGKKKVEIRAKEEKDKKEEKELAAEVVQSKKLDVRQAREKAREEEKKAREEVKTKKKIEAEAKKEARRKLKQEKKEARERLRKAREEEVRKKKREKILASELIEAKKLQLNAEEEAIAERVIGYYLEGEDCYHYRQYNEAIELFQKALELDPDYKKAANYLKKAQKKLDQLGNK